MLNAETKRHIDNARDILVGVVPNPTAQIDQITNALIYKFMDDMDQAAIKVGADPSFFIKDLEPYAWSRLMSDRLGNQERMNLYAEALTKFANASQLPQLFRDIFKSSFLPYRSPEVLGLFLKEINYFDYAHPEELGNAYEYLLQIMGSQGDAGQFRTPRHIIDFVVDVVNPTKDDKVLDPACGTAGFLISAYKHILEQHDGKDDPEKKEKPLTPEERKKLFANFEGHDIDPSMVRIAQVNMYLHQFKNPKVGQYDTLSQEERWSDRYDVILANPPFMSPRGGIRPHNKFSIQSTRSEVLFVDYIMNHLRPKGRAGIIVPEGIIFKSDTATKQLRKNLVEDGLYAVVSLPSGVFNPYAGVKTSILLFDNTRAKETDELLFVKIENDGYDLGAQRRPITKNDLPEALEVLAEWRSGEKKESSLAQWVAKATIAETGDYNLSAAKYSEVVDYSNAKWPMVALSEVANVRKGSPITKKDSIEGPIPVIAGGQQPAYYHNQSNREGDVITVSASGAYSGFVAYHQHPIFASDCSTIETKDNTLVSTLFIYHVLKAQQETIYALQKGGGQPHVYPKDLELIKIPLPPLDVQQQIAAELNGYQKIIDGARQVVDNWRPSFVVDPEWPSVSLSEIFTDLEAGVSVNSESQPADPDELGVLKTSAVTYGVFNPNENKKVLSEETDRVRVSVKADNIIISRMNTPALVGASAYVAEDYPNLYLPDRLWQTTRRIDSFLMKFVFFVLSSPEYRQKLTDMAGGTSGSMKNISKANLLSLEIPLPPLEVQQQIVDAIEAERAHVESARTLIDLYTQKTTSTITKLWSE